MESLYRKYRPQTFDDVVGQQHVVATLEHAVLEGRTSHAYLFCGPRGTGKTTMARLLAKALMCEQGPGHLPDGTCEQCRLIAAGEHPDVYELDAASRTGVDNVREEIINRVSYAPVSGTHKVYIIDEVHMLTTAAFNALLKTLEEPPAHVVFVLCTTDPQKVPETILSRVQRFDFHAISPAELSARLVYVCQQEGFSYDQAALDLVVRHARGGMRDALSTLEQLSVFGDGTISLGAAQDLLGEVAVSTLSSAADALARRDVPALFAEVGELVDAGRDLLQFSRELAAHLRDVYVVAAVGARENVLAVTPEELTVLQNEAAAFGSVDRLSRALGILGDASSEMRTATNQRLVLELAFTKIARPESDLTVEALAERVERLELQVRALSQPGRVGAAVPASQPVSVMPTRPASAGRPVPVPQAVPQPAVAAQPAPAPQPPAPAAPTPQPAPAPWSTSTPQPKPAVTAAPAMQSAPQPIASAQSPAGQGAITDQGELQRRWRQVVDYLLKTAPARGSLLMNASLEADSGTELTVDLHQASPFAFKQLTRADVSALVDQAASEVFGRRHVTYHASGAPATAPQVAAPAPQHAPASVQQAAPISQAMPASPAPTAPAPVPQQAAAPTMPATSVPPASTPAPFTASVPPASVPGAAPTPVPVQEQPPFEEPQYADELPPEAYDMPVQPAPAMSQQPAVPQTAPAPAPQAAHDSVSQPAAVPQAASAPAAQPQVAVPQPPTPIPEPAPQSDAANDYVSFDPTDAASVMAMLTDIFGAGVKDVSDK